MATHSSVLAWRIPWTEEAGGYSPWGRKESVTTERMNDKRLHWVFLATHRLSLVVGHGLSCPVACGIFPEQGSNHVACIGRQILYHCNTREVPTSAIFCS